jgi:dimethylglycine dehydrogenase
VLAFAYIKPAAAAPGTALEVVVMNEVRTATVLGEAAYDPQNLLPRTDG